MDWMNEHHIKETEEGLTGLGPSWKGLAGSGGVGGDDLDTVLSPAQQVDDQHGVHVFSHEGLQSRSRGCSGAG